MQNITKRVLNRTWESVRTTTTLILIDAEREDISIRDAKRIKGYCEVLRSALNVLQTIEEEVRHGGSTD